MDSRIRNYKFIESTSINIAEFQDDLLFTDKTSNAQLLDLCLNRKVHHVVQKSNLNPDKELSISAKLLEEPGRFFDFPFSYINDVDQPCLETESHCQKFRFSPEKASDKDMLLAKIEEYLAAITSSKTLLGDVLNAVDELFTNSIYNAPFVNHENSQSGVERDFESVSIDPNKRPVIYMGHNAEEVFVGCSDFYGSLNIESLLKRLRRCVENELSEVINYGSGGAGIGTYLIFDSCRSMYIAVQKLKQTTICCSFPYKLPAKQRGLLPKNIHIIEMG